jgi:hypothetical protein
LDALFLNQIFTGYATNNVNCIKSQKAIQCFLEEIIGESKSEII